MFIYVAYNYLQTVALVARRVKTYMKTPGMGYDGMHKRHSSCCKQL